MKIVYQVSHLNMGEATEKDGENYRAWAFNELVSRFPDAQIEVVDGEGPTEICGDETDVVCCVTEYIDQLWDRCPWSGEFFE